MADRELPDVDVPALTALLDGKYADIRQLTRKNLAEYAGVLDDAIEMPREEFRVLLAEAVDRPASFQRELGAEDPCTIVQASTRTS